MASHGRKADFEQRISASGPEELQDLHRDVPAVEEAQQLRESLRTGKFSLKIRLGISVF